MEKITTETVTQYRYTKETSTKVINGKTYQFAHTHHDATPESHGVCTVVAYRRSTRPGNLHPSWVRVHDFATTWQYEDVPRQRAGSYARRMADLLLRCLAALASEGIHPQSYGAPMLDDYRPGDVDLFMDAAYAVGGEKIQNWELVERLHGLEREAYEADPERWIREHTVDGVRPHVPPRPGEDDLRRITAERFLETTPVLPLEENPNRPTARWTPREDGQGSWSRS